MKSSCLNIKKWSKIAFDFFFHQSQFLKYKILSLQELSSLSCFQRSVTLQSKIKPNYPIMDMAVFNGETWSSESRRRERTRKRRWTEKCFTKIYNSYRRIFKPLINESTSDGLVWWMEINRDPISKWPKRAVKTVSRENLREQPIREQFHSLQ